MSSDHESEPTPATYIKVFIALMVLLVLTTAVAFVDLDKYLPGNFWSLLVAMLIALAKGLLILLFFMHVKFSSRQTVVFAGAGFAWLAILLVLTMSDYLTRNHPPDLTYKGEPRYLNNDIPPGR
jgi:cytochrome c oxidase subunit 4